MCLCVCLYCVSSESNIVAKQPIFGLYLTIHSDSDCHGIVNENCANPKMICMIKCFFAHQIYTIANEAYAKTGFRGKLEQVSYCLLLNRRTFIEEH